MPALWEAVLARLRRLAGEIGEGVISTAIAVLIMAMLGAAMWVAFERIWGQAETDIQDAVNDIGD